MIMDEVLAVGDMAFQKKCLDKMRDVAKKEGRTVLYVSHNMNTIRQLCDRCVVLDKGKIIFVGDVAQAIEVYMNRSNTDDAVDIDLSNVPHMDGECNFDILMKRVVLEDKVVPVYFDTETMKLKCSITVQNPVQDVCFRLTLRTSEDVSVGTLWTSKQDFTTAGDADVMLEFDLSSVPKGKLNANIGFYQITDGGAFVMLDHVNRAFTIEINQEPRGGSIVWDTRYWGYIRFPDVDVEVNQH
jgi:lipopolysaccharide transport system ATP-binding protein